MQEKKNKHEEYFVDFKDKILIFKKSLSVLPFIISILALIITVNSSNISSHSIRTEELFIENIFNELNYNDQVKIIKNMEIRKINKTGFNQNRIELNSFENNNVKYNNKVKYIDYLLDKEFNRNNLDQNRLEIFYIFILILLFPTLYSFIRYQVSKCIIDFKLAFSNKNISLFEKFQSITNFIYLFTSFWIFLRILKLLFSFS